MTPAVSLHELIRRFNEDKAVWSRYEQRRAQRRFLGSNIRCSEEILDVLDWIEAERECRPTQCVGTPTP